MQPGCRCWLDEFCNTIMSVLHYAQSLKYAFSWSEWVVARCALLAGFDNSPLLFSTQEPPLMLCLPGGCLWSFQAS